MSLKSLRGVLRDSPFFCAGTKETEIGFSRNSDSAPPTADRREPQSRRTQDGRVGGGLGDGGNALIATI